MRIPKYTAFLICLWLLLFICLPGCEDSVEPAPSLRFRVKLSPSAARVQQEATDVVVYVYGARHEFSIDEGWSEYTITPDAFGETVVRVQYIDSLGNILCEGEESVDISRFGLTDVTVVLTCDGKPPDRKPKWECVDFSSLAAGYVLPIDFAIENVAFHLEDEAWIEVDDEGKGLGLYGGNIATVKLPEPANIVSIAAWVGTDGSGFWPLDCAGEPLTENMIPITVGESKIVRPAEDVYDICSLEVIGEELVIREICYQYLAYED